MANIINNTEEQKAYNEIVQYNETIKDINSQIQESLENEKWYDEYDELKMEIKELNNKKKEFDKRFNDRDDIIKMKESIKWLKIQIWWRKEKIWARVIQNTIKEQSTEIFDKDKNWKNIKVCVDWIVPILRKEKIEE